MFHKALCILVVCLLAVTRANTLQGTIELNRLQSILQEGIKSKDISTLYFAIKGLKDLKATIPDVCQDIKSAKYDINNIEQIFHLTNAAALSGCQNYLSPDVLKAPGLVMDKKDATIPELYHAVYTLKALGKGSIYDKEDGLKNLIQLLKKDDSPINYGYVFGLCEHMGCTPWTTSHAEGVLQAADETDSKALSFDGGLPATSLLLTTILRSYKSQKKASPLSEEQRYKFAEYLLSRRGVGTPRGAALLLAAATALADDEPSPISIVFNGKKYVTSESDSVEFSITDLLGRPLRSLKPDDVVAQSGTRLADDVVVLSKQVLTQKPNEPTTFVLNLSKIKAQYGLYKIALSAGSKTTNVNVAVLGEIQVSSVEVGVGDVDGTTSPRVTTVAYPGKLPEKLQADHMQKVTLKFSVRDKYNKPVSVAQAFVRVGAPHAEAIFVAEHDAAKAYKVDLNVGAIAKHLNHASGAYSLEVFLGDSAVSNPIAWHLGQVGFNFGKDANAVGEVVKASSVAHRGPLPEISHVFRSPEARPPRLVSDVFACACAAPLLLLLLLWAKLDVNFKLFPVSLSALIFHLSLGGRSMLMLYRSCRCVRPRLVSDVFACACAAPLLLLLWAKLEVNFKLFPVSLSALIFHLSLGGRSMLMLYPSCLCVSLRCASRDSCPLLLLLWAKLKVNFKLLPVSLSALIFHLSLGGRSMLMLYPSCRCVRPRRASRGSCPLLLLLLLWVKLEVNFKLFPVSLSALIFHLSLGGSLALYGVVWLQLTMFEAARYLLPLGALTFLAGHRTLRRLANNKQALNK